MHKPPRINIFIAVIVVFINTACGRSVDVASKINIKSPNDAGRLSVWPVGRKVCFGANVKATDIKGYNGDSCSPPTGIVAGFVELGKNIEVILPSGIDRTVELYALLKPPGDTSPCPVMMPKIPPAFLRDLYLVASVGGIKTDQDVNNITITATFPGVTQNIAVTNNYPVACLPTLEPGPAFAVAAGSGESLGTNFQMRARVGRAAKITELIGTNYRIKVPGQ